MAKISIVLAVYNGEKDVDKCLNSLRGQTMKDVEIICVDDGSVDNTVGILKHHASEDSRVKVFEQVKNKKLLLAIKRGVKEATGDYIMFIDDDDWYEPNACERVVEIIDAEHPDVVYFGTKLVESEQKVSREIKENRIKRLRTCNKKFSGENTLWLDEIGYVYLWNKAVKADVAKKAYDAIPDVEMTYYSDIYANMMIHYYAKSLACIADKLINYNYTNGLSAQTVMSGDDFEKFLKYTRIYLDGFGDFLKKHGSAEDVERFSNEYNERILHFIRRWRDRVADEDAVKAFESLANYYGIEVVLPMLKINYHRVRASRNKYKRKCEKLERQLKVENKKKKSILSKLIGR